MKVHVLDDEPMVVTTVKTALEAIGFHVRTSLSGAEARQGITEEPPDLALIDLKLQDGDGLDILRWLKRNHPDIPVVVLTGYDVGQVTGKALEFGALEIIEKPLTIPEIQHRIQTIVDRLGNTPQDSSR